MYFRSTGYMNEPFTSAIPHRKLTRVQKATLQACSTCTYILHILNLYMYIYIYVTLSGSTHAHTHTHNSNINHFNSSVLKGSEKTNKPIVHHHSRRAVLCFVKISFFFA